MITAEVLKQIPLFSGLPDNERASLAARAADVHVKADEWLLLEGQAPAFFALLEGRLSLFKSIAGHSNVALSMSALPPTNFDGMSSSGWARINAERSSG